MKPKFPKLGKKVIPFSSAEGMRRFFSAPKSPSHLQLMERFEPQSNPVFCGVTSSVIVLNSLLPYPSPSKFQQFTFLDKKTDRIKPRKRILKAGPQAGLTLTQVVKILKLKTPQTKIQVLQNHRAEFVQYLLKPKYRVIANFATDQIWGGRGGHFSPLAAYDPSSHSVLILDVAQHRTPWYWCPVELLVKASMKIDLESNEPRGFVIVVAH